MDNKEHVEKFKKYEAEFKQYLMSKYFSDKTIFGGKYLLPLILVRELDWELKYEQAILLEIGEEATLGSLSQWSALRALFATHSGNIFDVKMNIDGQTITASRLPPYQSYLDPATFNEMISKGSSSSAETPTTSNSNGKPST